MTLPTHLKIRCLLLGGAVLASVIWNNGRLYCEHCGHGIEDHLPEKAVRVELNHFQNITASGSASNVTPYYNYFLNDKGQI